MRHECEPFSAWFNSSKPCEANQRLAEKAAHTVTGWNPPENRGRLAVPAISDQALERLCVCSECKKCNPSLRKSLQGAKSRLWGQCRHGFELVETMRDRKETHLDTI